MSVCQNVRVFKFYEVQVNIKIVVFLWIYLGENAKHWEQLRKKSIQYWTLSIKLKKFQHLRYVNIDFVGGKFRWKVSFLVGFYYFVLIFFIFYILCEVV